MLFKLVKEDIKQGIIKRYPIFLWTFISSAVLAFVTLRTMIDVRHMVGNFTMGDTLSYLFRGMAEYVPERTKEGFDVSEYYLVWIALLALVIGHYPIRDIKGTGRLKMIKSGKKLYWWLSKCIWCIATSISFWGSLVVGTFVGTLISGIKYECVDATSFALNEKMFEKVFGNPLAVPGHEIVYKLLLLSFLGFITLSMIQLLFMMVGNAIVGYIAVIAVAVMSAYKMTSILPGNAIMVYRYVEVNAKGITVAPTCIACLIFILICIVVGYVSFKRKDII